MYTIAQLEREGWEGIDASLEISLFEYGLAALEQDDGSIDVIYGTQLDDSGVIYSHFIRTSFDDKEEIYNIINNSWFDLEGFMSSCDFDSVENIRNTYYLHVLDSMKWYYGNSNIFGEFMADFEISDGEPILVAGSANGLYIPQIFAEKYRQEVQEQFGDEILSELSTPDYEYYWEAWEDVLDRFETEINGVKHVLIHDEDLWLVPESEAENWEYI